MMLLWWVCTQKFRIRYSGVTILFTARIRSMTGRYCFHRCLSVNILGGVPHPGLDGGGVPHLRSGGTPSQVWGGGYPIPEVGVLPQPGLDGGGYPISGGYPGQVLMMGGIPHPGGYPGQILMMGGVPPTSRPGWDTPHPPTLGWGTPWPGMGYPPRQSSIASTCYAAGSMPLVFTQEDFLVNFLNLEN